MLEALRRRLLGLLRIPAEPHVPPGEEAHAEVFRAGEGYYNFLLLKWFFQQVGALAGLMVGTAFLHSVLVLGRVPWGAVKGKGAAKALRAAQAVPWEAFLVVEAFAWAGFLLACAGTFLLLVWDYRCRHYILTDRCLRIQEGLWTFREQTFSLANIQDLDVRRGPLQRFLGIGDLVVRTAGGGSEPQDELHTAAGGGNLHQGRLRGVAEPERLRDRLLARMRAHAADGLGGPGPAGPPDPGLEAAAREALTAARALREALPAR